MLWFLCWNQNNSNLWCSSVKSCTLHTAWRKNALYHLEIHTHLARIVKTRSAELPEVIPLIWSISVGSLNISVGCKSVWALWDTKLQEKKKVSKDTFWVEKGNKSGCNEKARKMPLSSVMFTAEFRKDMLSFWLPKWMFLEFFDRKHFQSVFSLYLAYQAPLSIFLGSTHSDRWEELSVCWRV